MDTVLSGSCEQCVDEKGVVDAMVLQDPPTVKSKGKT